MAGRSTSSAYENRPASNPRRITAALAFRRGSPHRSTQWPQPADLPPRHRGMTRGPGVRVEPAASSISRAPRGNRMLVELMALSAPLHGGAYAGHAVRCSLRAAPAQCDQRPGGKVPGGPPPTLSRWDPWARAVFATVNARRAPRSRWHAASRGGPPVTGALRARRLDGAADGLSRAMKVPWTRSAPHTEDGTAVVRSGVLSGTSTSPTSSAGSTGEAMNR